MNIRLIAIYLPQFHPIKENNEWWGKGFTEWTNVTKAKPLFKDHYQPHLPADLGFYDLRLEETRLAQEALAKEYGIFGFCYYHYWFNGKRLLETPIERKMENPKEDLPFMLCWANENWTRSWDGLENNILLKQEYSEQDDVDHIRALIPTFKDPRYIKVNGKPVFVIYRSTKIPNVKETISTWRREAKKENLELYLCRMETFGEHGKNFLLGGFDAAINFQPSFKIFSQIIEKIKARALRNKFSFWYVNYKMSSFKRRKWFLSQLEHRMEYDEYVSLCNEQQPVNYKLFPGVMPMWDNSSRRKDNYFVFKNSTPEKYQEWLENEVNSFRAFGNDENFLFINAWNEWAEGNHLEPCQKWGKRYLEATKNAINS